jgi:long-chain acyl-CoA synthetase
MGDTIPKLMLEYARKEPELTVQWSKDSTGTFQPILWRQLRSEVEAFAAGLLDLGVERGDHIGVVSENMKEWLWADLAMLSIPWPPRSSTSWNTPNVPCVS